MIMGGKMPRCSGSLATMRVTIEIQYVNAS